MQVWPHGEFPLIPVGKMVLDRNPKNYFAEVEQIAFSPAHMIPGVEPSPDKMLQVSYFFFFAVETQKTLSSKFICELGSYNRVVIIIEYVVWFISDGLWI